MKTSCGVLLTDGAALLLGHATGSARWDIPKGEADLGEDHAACAARELREETGYSASDWQFICTIHNAIAYCDEHLEIFLARGLTPGQQQLDDGEFVELFDLPLEALLDEIRMGRITDVKTIIGAFWLDKIHRGEWTPPGR